MESFCPSWATNLRCVFDSSELLDRLPFLLAQTLLLHSYYSRGALFWGSCDGFPHGLRNMPYCGGAVTEFGETSHQT